MSRFRPDARGGRKSPGSGTRFLARYSITRQLQILSVLLLVLLSSVGVLVYHGNRAAAENATYIVTMSDLRMLSQRIAKVSSLALRGDPIAFMTLRDAHRQFSSHLNHLRDGGELDDVSVPPSPRYVEPQLENLIVTWQYASRNIVRLLEAEAQMVIFGKYLRGFSVGSERGFGIGSERVYVSTRDAETRRIVAELDAVFDEYATVVNDILGDTRILTEARRAVGNILVDDASLFDAVDALDIAYRRSGSDGRALHQKWLVALTILVLTVLATMGKVYIDETRRQAELARRSTELAEKSRRESERINRQNQEAILRLMNELGDLADGDLTVMATVSEDITGAIADSINYTVEELRILVGRINDAASRVTAATEIAQQTSVELLDAAQRQSQEIQNAGHSVLEMARAMNHVSSDADQSAQVARQSLAAAGKGALAVQNSIKGMDEIRRQIQETSKRIKHLGESSQEIGEIVELISDITEQTNVLALNAAIQAASAGEAGRGFTVVAEEVQRLAERSGGATKQIAAIVKAIQNDTQGAISAMEESTRGVVEETKLSDAAGQALAEIGVVSRNLAELIERISEATRQQADAATGVAGKMQSILEVTEQTTAGTQRTASAVGELAGLATELKGSVAGFKV
ncbi:MAG: methyl-accepting chemotaxis protein [Candidatus Accumulibacter sp.]|jgi:twitching motility protein PilJ|nr:methyl-accepting chemotaxis protein [Accumulibacter sp.]